jgi:L-fuconolactonase
MPTIDVQEHAYERNHPGRPWAAILVGPPEVTDDQMVAATDAIGVDGALLVSRYTVTTPATPCRSIPRIPTPSP